jgi:hypothetical protein
MLTFFDMTLIHIFTRRIWLSATGELLTVVFFICFHFTKETLYESLETTLIAVLVSFHLIGTRKQVMEERDTLQRENGKLERRGAILVHAIKEEMHHEDGEKEGASDCKGSSSETEMLRSLKEEEGLEMSESLREEDFDDWFHPEER